MRIATASPEDLRAVAQLHVASWQSAYAQLLSPEYLANLSVERSEASWHQILAEGHSELLVAFEGVCVVGFVSFGPCRNAGARPECGEVWAITLCPAPGRLVWVGRFGMWREPGSVLSDIVR